MSDLPPNILADIARRRLNLQTGADTNKRRLEETYGLNKEDIGRSAETGRTNINNNMGARGLFNSGIRIDEQGRLSKNVAQRYSDLETAKSRGLEDINTGLTTGLGDLDSYQQEQSRVYGQQLLQEQLSQQQAAAQQAQLDAMARSNTGGGASTSNMSMDELMALLGQQGGGDPNNIGGLLGGLLNPAPNPNQKPKSIGGGKAVM